MQHNQDRKLYQWKNMREIRRKSHSDIKEMKTRFLTKELSGLQNRTRLSWSICSSWDVHNSCPQSGFSSTSWLQAAAFSSLSLLFWVIYMNLIITLRLSILVKNRQFLQKLLGRNRPMYVYKQRQAPRCARCDHIYSIYSCIFSKLSWRINYVSASIYLITSEAANSWLMIMI